MAEAIGEAEVAFKRGEVPVGAVIVSPERQVIARAGNMTLSWHDPTAHAEVVAIRAACAALGSERLSGHDLYVTLEPCAMCAAAISFARIRRLYIGALDEKSGGVFHGGRFFTQATCHHAPEVYEGLDAERCGRLMTEFFASRRG